MRRLVATAGVLAALSAAAVAQPVPQPAAAARGDGLYQQRCAACHGAEGRGGPGGAPNLTTSTIITANDGGRQLMAFLASGRPDRGMPAFAVSEEQGADLWARFRAPPVSARRPEPVFVGNPGAGKAYFNGPVGRCNTCHAVRDSDPSAAANLAHIAGAYPDPRALQDNMILKGRRYYWSPANSRDITATVTWRDGRTLRGYLSSVSDFKVIVRDETGKETVLERRRGEPKVVLVDRMQAHLDLLRVYRDSDIHDLTAYLASLK